MTSFILSVIKLHLISNYDKLQLFPSVSPSLTCYCTIMNLIKYWIISSSEILNV